MTGSAGAPFMAARKSMHSTACIDTMAGMMSAWPRARRSEPSAVEKTGTVSWLPETASPSRAASAQIAATAAAAIAPLWNGADVRRKVVVMTGLRWEGAIRGD